MKDMYPAKRPPVPVEYEGNLKTSFSGLKRVEAKTFRQEAPNTLEMHH